MDSPQDRMKRSPLRRKTRLRAKSRKPDVRELDRLARAVVFARDGNKCAWTGTTDHLQWAHVYSRRYRSVRWDPDNSMCLSAKMHLFWHHQPLRAAEWFEATYPERAKRLRLKMQSKQKVDMVATKLSLEQELKRLTGR